MIKYYIKYRVTHESRWHLSGNDIRCIDGYQDINLAHYYASQWHEDVPVFIYTVVDDIDAQPSITWRS